MLTKDRSAAAGHRFLTKNISLKQDLWREQFQLNIFVKDMFLCFFNTSLLSSACTGTLPFLFPRVGSWAAAGCHACAMQVENYNGQVCNCLLKFSYATVIFKVFMRTSTEFSMQPVLNKSTVCFAFYCRLRSWQATSTGTPPPPACPPGPVVQSQTHPTPALLAWRETCPLQWRISGKPSEPF